MRLDPSGGLPGTDSMRSATWGSIVRTFGPNFRPWCGSASGTGCVSIISAWIAPARPPSPRPSFFATGPAGGRSRRDQHEPASLGISYEYSFIHREQFELAATFGINDTDLRPAPASPRKPPRESDGGPSGPLPDIGLDSTYVVSKRFYFDARAQYFKLAVDHLDRTVSFLRTGGSVPVSAQRLVRAGLHRRKGRRRSRRQTTWRFFDLSSKGPEVFVRIAF